MTSRRGWLAGLALGICIGAVLGPMVLGTVPRTESAFGLTAGAGVSVAGLESGTTFAPLDVEALRILMGDAPVGRPPPRVSAPHAAPTPAERSIRPTHRRIPPPGSVTSASDLRIRIQVDRAEAAPGDIITYAIGVTNAGRGTARGVRVTSRVPEHTTWVDGDGCGPRPVTVAPGQGPVPGTPAVFLCPAGSADEFAAEFAFLGPGDHVRIELRVVVNADAPNGFVILNHADVVAEGVPARTSNQVSTVVRAPV